MCLVSLLLNLERERGVILERESVLADVKFVFDRIQFFLLSFFFSL